MKLPILVILLLITTSIFSQQNEMKYVSLEADYFYGTIIEHNKDISHLITGHPTGIMLAYNRKTYGFNEWEGRYNYPDWGFTFAYQDMKNQFLGENYSVYGHFNFYFLNRALTFGMGQGLAYNTNPYDPDTNFQNNAYGSQILSSTFLRFNYVKENIYKGLGVHTGFGVIHYSNANFKAPNTSTNTIYFNVGMSYRFDKQDFPVYIPVGRWKSSNYAERFKYNVVLRGGINEADVNGLGQYPSFTFSTFVDKRINYKSTLQAGVDVFFSSFLKELINYRSIAFPEDGLTGNEDYKRVGVFIGHEFRFNKVAFVSQLGYYIYWPYEFENRIYNRLGIKRYFLKDRFFGAVTLHAHWAKAESIEIGIGVRL
ncbi:MAG: acyloxyacyl hydrolase [Flavobacteriaceae bacterium]|nr:acyloxyacyl hydrolase [Flavobacteriaceae bacterium]